MVKRDRAQVEEKIETYLQRLDQADYEDAQSELDRERVQQALERLHRRKQRLETFERGMQASGLNEHCVTEPEARLMRSGREGMVLGYNVQTAVEADTGLIIHHEVTDEPGDTRQLLPIAEQTKASLRVEQLQVVADGGYSNGEHLLDAWNLRYHPSYYVHDGESIARSGKIAGPIGNAPLQQLPDQGSTCISSHCDPSMTTRHRAG